MQQNGQMLPRDWDICFLSGHQVVDLSKVETSDTSQIGSAISMKSGMRDVWPRSGRIFVSLHSAGFLRVFVAVSIKSGAMLKRLPWEAAFRT